MKRLWLIFPLLMTGCSSIRYVTTDHGRLVTQDNKPVQILGNPPVVCHVDFGGTYSGYFEYQDDDGTIVLDDFGRGTIILRGKTTCKLGLDDIVADPATK